MPKEGYIRTTAYLRPDLYTRARELNFNLSEWINECLSSLFSNGSSENIANLLNEERKLKARLVQIQQEISSTSRLAAIETGQANQTELEKKRIEAEKLRREQKEAVELLKRDPKAYAKKYLPV